MRKKIYNTCNTLQEMSLKGNLYIVGGVITFQAVKFDPEQYVGVNNRYST